MKKYNKLPLVIGILAGVPLLTAGFAGWIITGSTALENQEFVDVTVGAITDNRIVTTIDGTADKAVVFDSNADASGSKGELKGDGNKEDMQFGAKIKVAFTSQDSTPTGNIGDIIKGFQFSFKANDQLKNALTSNYIEFPYDIKASSSTLAVDYKVTEITDWTKSSTGAVVAKWGAAALDSYVKTSYEYTVDTSNKFATLDFKFGFKWGTVFNSVNPCQAEFKKDTVGLNNAISALKELHKLNDAKNLLSITVTPLIS